MIDPGQLRDYLTIALIAEEQLKVCIEPWHRSWPMLEELRKALGLIEQMIELDEEKAQSMKAHA